MEGGQTDPWAIPSSLGGPRTCNTSWAEGPARLCRGCRPFTLRHLVPISGLLKLGTARATICTQRGARWSLLPRGWGPTPCKLAKEQVCRRSGGLGSTSADLPPHLDHRQAHAKGIVVPGWSMPRTQPTAPTGLGTGLCDVAACKSWGLVSSTLEAPSSLGCHVQSSKRGALLLAPESQAPSRQHCVLCRLAAMGGG